MVCIPLGIMVVIKEVYMEKYFNFNNEASRSEFWAVNLIAGLLTMLATISVIFLTGVLALANPMLGGLFMILGILAIVVFGTWVQLATAARRCNEAGISRWWMIALLVPFVGLITFIVLGCIGPDPFRKVEK